MLELLWGQLVLVRPVEDVSGLVGVVLVGSHRAQVQLDRTLRGLADLARPLAERHR